MEFARLSIRIAFALLAMLALAPAACAGQENDRPLSYVKNGGYEQGLAGWNAPSGKARVVASPRGGQCLEVDAGATATQDVYIGGNIRTYTVAVDMKASGIVPQGKVGYAYVALYQLDSRGQYLVYRDFGRTSTDQEWTRHTYTFEVHPDARVLSLRCGIFQAKGTAWVDNWTLVAGNTPQLLTEVREPQPFTGSTKGIVGIFNAPGFPAKGAGSRPEVIASILREAGMETHFLDIAALSDPSHLRPWRYDIVVLPYGESFPAEARDSLTYYLHDGGDFISMGGYTFLNPLLADGKGYAREEEVLDKRLAEAIRPEKSLLFDGGFEKPETRAVGIGGSDLEARWRRTSETCQIVDEHPAEGRYCARVTSHSPKGEVQWHLRLPGEEGRRYRISAQIRAQDVTGEGFAYLAIYRYGHDGNLIKYNDFAHVRGTAPWKRYEFDFTPEPGTATLFIKCGLFRAQGTIWVDDVRLGKADGTDPRPMNTATGHPGDGLITDVRQIGVFDADYRLKRVHRVETAPGQTIFPAGIRLGTVRGWAASATRGYDNTRWIPLLMSYDRYGRPRGSAGSLLINYSGFYAGSAWGYFGVEDRDLFDGKDPLLRKGLQRLAQFMVRAAYLRNLESDFASYAPGSPVRLKVTFENRGPARQEGLVFFRVLNGGKELMRKRVPVAAGSLDHAVAETSFTLPKTVAGLCHFTATLSLGGETVDSMESGFFAISPQVARRGPTLRFRDNYFRYGDRALFLFGCDNYSNVYRSTTEGPLWWAREHAACRDYGFELYENLQYNNPGHVMTEVDWRRFDGMTQSTQEHGLVFMPGLLIGHNVAVSDERIREESRQCSEYAARYKEIPGLLWYINGDYALRHEDMETLRAKWNAFLKQRYGTDEKLKAAWAPEVPPAPLGALPFPPENPGRWDSVSQIDLYRFHVHLMTEWNRAHVAAIRAHDAEHPITSEYYSYPRRGIDLRLTIAGQDVSNIGYFDEPVRDLDYLPLRIRLNDVRVRGKSVSLGEYGVKTHPAWSLENGARGYHIVRTEEEAKQLFMAVAHYTFGMGGSKVQNWCLRDSDQRVFPWGVFYPGPLIPKDIAYTHRNLSLLMRAFEPRYEPPALTVLLNDNMRLGNQENLGIDSAYRCFAALLGLHADFNVASDWFADSIPASTRVIIYPSAICPGDESYTALLRWVRNGGTLLMTGAPIYDAARKPGQSARLRELAGVEWVSTRYTPDVRGAQAMATLRTEIPGLAGQQAAPMVEVRPAGAKVLATDAAGKPVLTKHTLGQGTVYYFADPIELAESDEGTAMHPLYRWFLEEAKIERLLVTPDNPQLHLFAQRTRTGHAHVLFNYRKGDAWQEATLATKAGSITLRAKDRYPAIAGVGDDGAVTVLGAHQLARVGSETLLAGEGMATAISLDELDLRKSEAVMLLPFTKGEVVLSRSQPWRRPVVLLGDIQDGQFRPLERLNPAPGTRVTLPIDDDRATLVGLICEQGQEARWIKTIGQWVSDPGSVPGR